MLSRCKDLPNVDIISLCSNHQARTLQITFNRVDGVRNKDNKK